MKNKQAKTPECYESTRYNATKHGALSKVPVLPWENAEDFSQLEDAFITEYNPQGASEEHLVLEMANCIFRKQRIYKAENALIISRTSIPSSYTLKRAANLIAPKVDLTPSVLDELNLGDILHDNKPLQENELVAFKKLLASIQAIIDLNCTYEEMLKRCPADTRKDWHDWLNAEDSIYTADAKSFIEFLKIEVIEWYEEKLKEFLARPYLKQQLIGLSHVPSHETENLQRHENALDRRFEKSLAMLLKIQEVRILKSEPSTLIQTVNSVL